jgi:hypothetical protein
MPGDDREHRIRELAHAIWEQEGRPEGQAERHWRMAEEAVKAETHDELEVSMMMEIASTTSAVSIIAPI